MTANIDYVLAASENVYFDFFPEGFDLGLNRTV
jgi:hypothetical protein